MGPLVPTLTLSMLLHLAIVTILLLTPGRFGRTYPEGVVTLDLDSISLAPPQTPMVQRPTSSGEGISLPPREEAIPQSTESEPREEAPPSPSPDTGGSSLSLGLARGFFRSLGDGETLRNDVREYYFELLEKVNEAWWTTTGNAEVEPGNRDAMVSITVTRSGEIVDVRLLRSSGNEKFDRLIVDSLRSASHLPPLPDDYQGEFFQAPLRLMAPRGLLFS